MPPEFPNPFQYLLGLAGMGQVGCRRHEALRLLHLRPLEARVLTPSHDPLRARLVKTASNRRGERGYHPHQEYQALVVERASGLLVEDFVRLPYARCSLGVSVVAVVRQPHAFRDPVLARHQPHAGLRQPVSGYLRVPEHPRKYLHPIRRPVPPARQPSSTPCWSATYPSGRTSTRSAVPDSVSAWVRSS